MSKSLLASLAFIAALASSVPVMAQTSTDPATPSHPRVNEVDTRVQNQEQRINNGVQNGTMTSGQAARDQARLNRIQQRAQTLENAQNGHLTKRETRRLNRSLNKDSHAIDDQKHYEKKD